MFGQTSNLQLSLYGAGALLLVVVFLAQGRVASQAADASLRLSHIQSAGRVYVAGRERGPGGWKVGVYGRGARFEVDVPDAGEPLWAWSGDERVWWRDDAGVRFWQRLGEGAEAAFVEVPFEVADVKPDEARAWCAGEAVAEAPLPPAAVARGLLGPKLDEVVALAGGPCPAIGEP